jgi:hypothetical protein
MKKKDIELLSSLFNQVILQENAGNEGEAEANKKLQELVNIKAYSENKYDKLDQGLRENYFTTADDKPIVLFYTMKVSEDKNDLLHNAAGPAVVFEGGGDGNEFYFINGKQVDPESDEFKTAQAEVEYQGRATRLGKRKTDTLSSGGSDLDIFD